MAWIEAVISSKEYDQSTANVRVPITDRLRSVSSVEDGLESRWSMVLLKELPSGLAVFSCTRHTVE